jgi:hypothetical protein
MQSRRSAPPSTSLYHRLNQEAQRLRSQADAAQPGVERERLIRRARQVENASGINEWLSSPGQQPPR